MPKAPGEKDYLIAANHFIIPEMKPVQQPWEPIKYYPASWYRYLTVAKYIEDSYGKINETVVMGIMGSTEYWDGQSWHRNAGWTGNTVDRFLSSGATLGSKVALPQDKTVYICTGNPGTTYWGGGAPGQTEALKLYGHSTTDFCIVQAKAKRLKEMLNTIYSTGK